MKILILGSSGFIGKTLAQTTGVNFAGFDIKIHPSMNVLHSSELHKIIKGVKPDLIYHLASPSSQIMFSKHPQKSLHSAILGTLNVLEASHGIPVIIPSTSSLYGAKNDYAKSKSIIEDLTRHYENVTFKRIFAGYGPNEDQKGNCASVIYQWLKQVKNNGTIEIWGDGTQSRDFVYQDDIAKNLIDLPQELDIGTGVSTTFNEIIEIIKDVTKREVKVVYRPKPQLYLEHTQCTTPNCSTSIRDGIRLTWESILKVADSK